MSVRYSFSSTRISETPLPHYVKFKKITSFKQKEKKKKKEQACLSLFAKQSQMVKNII